MRKTFFLVLTSIIVGFGQVTAQTVNNFEGEVKSKVNSIQKATSQTTTKNFLAKMIMKKILKKHFDDNPGYYTGVYDNTTISKGNKMRSNVSYNNSVVITETNGDIMKTTTYYPYIQKGYYNVINLAESQKKMAEMKQGTPEKTGETITILGKQCDIYKVKYESTTDSAGMKMVMNVHNEYAICNDLSMPQTDKDVIPGVKGVPLKVFVNSVSQMTNEMLNLDFLMSVSTIVTSITPRSVADSEFEIPAKVKLFDADKDPKKLLKVIEENKKYMEKKKLWVEKSPDEMKIYDNLNEEWEY